MKRLWSQYLERVLGVLLPTSAAGLAVSDQAVAREVDIGPGSTSRLRDIEPVPFSSPVRIDGPDRFAGHRSHSSHSSHRSHYSSSSGTYSPSPSTAPSSSTSTPSSTNNTPQNLTPKGGSAGAATDEGMLVAMRAQLELKKLRYYAGAIDGVLGPETRDALLRFQKAQNLAASGVLDNSTLSKLGIRP